MSLEHLKYVTDAAAAAIALGSVANIVPHVAALFTIIWLAIRIWESDTVRWMTGRVLTGKRDDG